jgi:LacI family transcriptional regulator
MATIKDVARHAGVSVGTVSRVISKTAEVKQPLRERVEAAIQDLGYRPNLAARALRTKRIESIGLVVPDVTNPFFAQLAKHVESEATQRGLTVMLVNTNDDKVLENTHLAALLAHAPRGIIVVAAASGQDYSLESETPFVAVDRQFMSYPVITTDNTVAAALAADHLHSLGHRRVMYISGSADADISAVRQSGFEARLNALGTPDDPVSIETQEGRFDYKSGEVIGRQILSRRADLRPTAIACGSDQIAIGVLRAAHDMGVEVPKELSVVGFDDIDIGNLVVPHLTTIRQPIEDLAKHAVELLLSGARDCETLLQAKLVVRDSTAVLANAQTNDGIG